MPAGRITLIDAMQPHLILGGVVTEHQKAVPALGYFPITRLDRGLKYTTQFMVELPTTGFRKLGDGIAASKGRYEEREFKCYLFGGRAEAEIAAYQADSGGEGAVKARVVRDTAQSALETLDNQIFYGVVSANGADGFPGLKGFTPFGGAYTLNATGSTSSTASSVYGVKFGEDYASLIHGSADPMNLGDWRKQDILGNNSLPIPGEVADLEGWIGMAIKHKASVVRICNLTAQTGKGVTDKLLGDAIDLLPTKMMPDVWFMSKRSRTQLRLSRATPENVYPDMPTESNGIPIQVDDSILDTDAIEA
jgi:hypothetical protein